MKLNEIWRFPVKSLSGQRLESAVLNPGLGLPHDRRWGLARPGGDAAQGGVWVPKSQFLVLVRAFGLAELTCHFEQLTGHLSLKGPNGLHAEGPLNTAEGRTAIAHAVAKHLGLSASETPVLVEAASLGYVDSTQGPVSILNVNSLRALEEAVGRPLDPLRFRMNLIIEGADAWTENTWPGKRIRIGKVELQVTESTGRCQATHVNPETGQADANLLRALKNNFGHTQFGVYAQVVSGGLIQPGDGVERID